jgi:5-methylcytosine-specific restriction endonuclease McrA
MPEPSPEWIEQHNRYLASTAWGERRVAVLQRDKYQCQARLDRCDRKATQVHHLSYRHWRNEPLFDLISVCWQCHEEITRMERGDLTSIVAEKESAHLRFERWWDADMRERLKSMPRSTTSSGASDAR